MSSYHSHSGETLYAVLNDIYAIYLNRDLQATVLAEQIIARLGVDSDSLSADDFDRAIAGDFSTAKSHRLISACKEGMALYSVHEPTIDFDFSMGRVGAERELDVLEFAEMVAVGGIIAIAHEKGLCEWGISDSVVAVACLYRFRAYAFTYLSVLKVVIPRRLFTENYPQAG